MTHPNEQRMIQAIRRIIIEHLRECSHCRKRWHDSPSAAHIFQALAPISVGPEVLVGIWEEITAAVEAELGGNK